jgi:hypothetical protein
MTENPGKLVPLGIVHTNALREQLMPLIEQRWQDGRLVLWGRRKGTSHPFEPIKEYKGLELLWMEGPRREDYYCDAQAHPSVIGKPGYFEHLWEDIQICEEDLKLLCAEIATTAPKPEKAPQTETISLIEAVHDLRVLHDTDLRSAIIEMEGLLATGQLPQADALIDGVPMKIDARWWWASTKFEYPNSSVVFNLVADGAPRSIRATEIRLDRTAWERHKARIPAAAQGNGPFPDWDDPDWDHPVKLLDAIRLWSPALARCFNQVKWVSPDEIGNIARRLRDYDDPTRVQYRRARAKRQREQSLNTQVDREASLDGLDATADRALPEPLRGDWARLLQEWDQWDDAERLVYAFELAARLIIEKTKPERPYLLEYAPPASDDDLSGDYRRVGAVRHEGLRPYDFDIRRSSIRSPGGNWLPARILGGIEIEAKRMRTARLAREARDRAAAAAWGAECAKPMRERQYFRFGDIADALATHSESLEIEAPKRDRIVSDLSDWTIRGEFDLSGDSEVVILGGEPPFFLPFGPVAPGGILADPEGLILRREACERYLRESSLQRAPGLLRDWFPETAVESHLPAEEATFPKAGQPNNRVAFGALSSGQVMPPDEAEQYTLLWDAAAKMARANGYSVERNWLSVMDAFWRHEFASSGIIYFYPAPPAGREFVALDRKTFAGMLLGHRDLEAGAKSIEDFRNWRIADYNNQPPPFGDFFKCDPEGRIGLAVLTHEFNGWHRGTENAAEPIPRHPIRPKKERPDDLRPAVNPALRAAIENAENSHGTPGKSVPWKTFCDSVRSICGVQPNARGYGDKSIERAVRVIKAEQDKQDKSDMSQMS